MEQERHGVRVPHTSPDRYAAATPSVHDIPSLFFDFRGYKEPDSTDIIPFGCRKSQFKYFFSSLTYFSPRVERIMFFFTT
jgi:hypothetical protein